MLCPCCGQERPEETTWDPERWRLTTKHGSVTLRGSCEKRIFDLLWRKRGVYGLTRQRIVDVAYADDEDGGPELGAIAQAMGRLRRLVGPIGVVVVGGTTGGLGYSLKFGDPVPTPASSQKPRPKRDRRDRSAYHRNYYLKNVKRRPPAPAADGPRQNA